MFTSKNTNKLIYCSHNEDRFINCTETSIVSMYNTNLKKYKYMSLRFYNFHYVLSIHNDLKYLY